VGDLGTSGVWLEPSRGGLRYETLKRAGFRYELCGVSADERAQDVDHIIPRKHGGTDDPDNLKDLCRLCNTNKGAGDDTDFRPFMRVMRLGSTAATFESAVSGSPCAGST
jgi:5-methylcytosine-specific restriction endonuclease McrA